MLIFSTIVHLKNVHTHTMCTWEMSDVSKEFVINEYWHMLNISVLLKTLIPSLSNIAKITAQACRGLCITTLIIVNERWEVDVEGRWERGWRGCDRQWWWWWNGWWWWMMKCTCFEWKCLLVLSFLFLLLFVYECSSDIIISAIHDYVWMMMGMISIKSKETIIV